MYLRLLPLVLFVALAHGTAHADLLFEGTGDTSKPWRFSFTLAVDDGVQTLNDQQLVNMETITVTLGPDEGILTPAREVLGFTFGQGPTLLTFTYPGGFTVDMSLASLLFEMPATPGSYVSTVAGARTATDHGTMKLAGSISTSLGVTDFGTNTGFAPSGVGFTVFWLPDQQTVELDADASSPITQGSLSWTQDPLSYTLSVSANPNSTGPVNLTLVPEPSTASLAGLGLLVLGAMGRRRS